MGLNDMIPKPPDVVTIVSERNPLNPKSPRTIVEVTIIGEAGKCERFLRSSEPYQTAAKGLIRSGFDKICEQNSDIYGVTIFSRDL
ncbi:MULTISPECIES: hypothetical protein [Heyndrickxia]|nr:hypothetical protein [Heyndrickxia oleronia]MCI1590024.1 hypothetical protein [Heyndrickxia oleronia]MCI1613350.1 hypothetical protein [Heyndrickxia oleronia]MCI1744742.1 hypothetical protein [Heyndrickxia oleronia]MCI1761299.1 hypothetical protein [Heyndrickxia oleronia]MCM3452851.1 hypothetical protein [Heyndrickxia oleronia]